MNNLLAHFEPSELVDFLNFLGLLIHKLQVCHKIILVYTNLIYLQKDLFNVLDELIAPLSAHIMALLAQPISGTDDQREHIETKKAFLALLNSVMASQLQGIFTSERKLEIHR